ncbi:response regulator transcription factor [Viridibacterium curvum]|uniref:Response regulatory domain-containing protein n=1 Tax=Viridibacterium curvum TaxID=1101404 RepID=A0ABP9QD88_9RHOO
MSNARSAVFVLEQDADIRGEVCRELAKVSSDVRGFAKGDELMAALQDHPAVCLLDLEAPGRGGLEICRALRARGDDAAHVILTSTDDNIQMRLTAFDVGCNDYCVKPLIPEEIVSKVDDILKAHEQMAALSSQLQYATTTAFGAMNSLAEMGTVMKFMRDVFACHTVEAVARAIVEACNQYDLRSLVSCKLNDNIIMLNEHGSASPLESSLLEHASQNDRITQFSGRLSITYPLATMLITNWPHSDEERAGRLRDHLAFVVESANIRLGVLQHDARRLEKTEMILSAVNGLMRMVDYLRERQQVQRESAMRMVADQGEAIARSFYSMGLSDAQEAKILNLVSGCGTEICKQMASFGLEQERMLEGIIETMHRLADD